MYCLKKDSTMLCGSYCLHYILNNIFNFNLKVPKDFFWITDLGNYILTNTNIIFDITCFNSKLYDDYLFLKNTFDFAGFTSITNYLNKGGILRSNSISAESLRNIINSKHIMIVNVSSQIFNSDTCLNGGHFICLLEIVDNDKVKILNPKKDHASLEIVSIETIIKSIENFGNWRITIERSGI